MPLKKLDKSLEKIRLILSQPICKLKSVSVAYPYSRTTSLVYTRQVEVKTLTVHYTVLDQLYPYIQSRPFYIPDMIYYCTYYTVL